MKLRRSTYSFTQYEIHDYILFHRLILSRTKINGVKYALLTFFSLIEFQLIFTSNAFWRISLPTMTWDYLILQKINSLYRKVFMQTWGKVSDEFSGVFNGRLYNWKWVFKDIWLSKNCLIFTAGWAYFRPLAEPEDNNLENIMWP